ncbi:helix-turn-helix domain-containing protein [Schinkia azotoformans]|uniref:helix-turn-helix domain-containing protein n=1 Tax=Schinkia azotoformans TaxID=1454 RepID=UPI002DBA7B59|nr:helix-turn-helix domain-containing protein [Schinkia azotoformans]MEC1722238.1 helix-turn-helix domain-containing protein [Schinkia azotoformans]MED4412400.1 helix-turn-helix domain-containing protein [Schinkia azotoformans]
MTEAEKQQIYDLRLKGVGYKAIAAVLGKSRDTVRVFCKQHGLDGDAKVVALNVKEQMKNHLLCSSCGKPIKQKKRGRVRKFCSDECRRKWWNENPQARKKRETAIYNYTCPQCGETFSCYGNKRRKFCSHDCYIKSRFWSEEDGI